MTTFDLQISNNNDSIRLVDGEDHVKIVCTGSDSRPVVVKLDFESFHHFMHLAEVAHAVMTSRRCSECHAELENNEEPNHDQHH